MVLPRCDGDRCGRETGHLLRERAEERRYAFLPFLYDDAAAKIREVTDYMRFRPE